jgi:small GTP-binding protein
MIGPRFDFSLKIVVMGDSGVGKTCLLIKYIKGIFQEALSSTLGVEFMSKIVQAGERRIQLQLWDTSGQEIFRSVTRGYYRGAAGALICFDLTRRETFDHVGRWLHDVRDVARPDVVTFLIGNKNDLVENRAVTTEEADAFADANKMQYYETSALTGDHLEGAMCSIVGILEKKVGDGAYEQQTTNIEPIPENGEEKGSCDC